MCHAVILATLLALTGAKPPQRIAFCGTENGKQNLYVINLDGTGLKQITTSPAEDRDPVWSPDGSTILFSRTPGHKKGERRSDGHLWTVRPDGTHLTRLTSGQVADSDYRWSHDGKRITFMREGPEHPYYELNLVTKKIHKISFEAWSAETSPDRKLFATLHVEGKTETEPRDEIWLTPSLGKKGRHLAAFRADLGDWRWSPNGKEIAVEMEMSTGAETEHQLCIVSVSSRKIRTLAKSHYLESPGWSPDGKRLCFLESDRHLNVISADGTGRRRLTDHGGEDFSPQWTRDGKFIVVQVMGGHTSDLAVVDASGGGERILPTAIPFCSSPALSP